MKKEHRFIVVVKTLGSRKAAETDLLVAFGRRQPDQSEFHLRKGKPKEPDPFIVERLRKALARHDGCSRFSSRDREILSNF